MKKLCRCNGLSGSCTLQTCWLSMSAFAAITSDIRRMYDNGIMLRLNNLGNVDNKNLRNDQLVYLAGENEVENFNLFMKLYNIYYVF